MGTFFAATQSALTVVATGIGRPAAGGLIYAVMAVGSAATALGTAAVPARFGPRLRCAIAAFGLLIGVLLMTTAGSVPLLCAAVLFTGLSVGPVLVTLNQVAGTAAPLGRAATTMAYLSVGSVIGIALGATTSGALADASGSLGPFAVAAAASVALFALALAGLRGEWPGVRE
jgi:MFS family permease